MAQIPIEQDSLMNKVVVKEESTSNEVHQRGATSALVAVDQGRDPIQAYMQATQSSDMQGMLQNWVQTTERDRLAVIEQQLGYMEPDKVAEELGELSTNLSGPMSQGNFVETVKSMPSSVGKTNAEIKREAVYMQLRETMADFAPRFEDMSWGEIAGEFGGTMIPKRKEEALLDFMTKMGFVDTVADKASLLLDPTSEILKLRNAFWSLDDDGQIAFMEALSEHLPNSTDNLLIRSEIVNDILGGEFNEDLSHLFAGLDTLDVSLLASGVVNLGKHMVKGGKLLNFARRTKENDLAADLINTAKENPEAAAKVGVTQADIGDAVNPLIHGDVATLLTGASDDTAAGIVKVLEMQDAHFKSVTEDMARHGLFTEEELVRTMREAEIKQMAQPGVIEASVSKIDETQFTVNWTEAHLDTLGRLRKRGKTRQVDFTVNDLGELDARKALDDEWVDKDIRTLDPNAKMQGHLRQWFVTSVETVARRQEMTAKAFDKMMRVAFKGLDKKSALIVDMTLTRGAKRGETYNYEQLRSGYTGMDITHNEARAYIATRNVVEKLYNLKNSQITDNLVAQGIKIFDDAENGPMAVRSYGDWRAAHTSWRQVGADSHHILVPQGGLRLKGVDPVDGVLPFRGKAGLTKEMLQEAYDKGYVLSRNHAGQNLFRKGDKMTQWAFVKKNAIHSPRGKQMLHRIEGYMPKQRTGAFYFIKKNKVVGLSGADDFSTSSTVAYSDNLESAQKWVNDNGKEGYEIVFDRDMTTDERLYATAKTHGGMYAGARKSEELAYVGLGDESFANTFEALQHYINHIGRQYPASLYRLGSEQRLLALAKDLGITSRDLSLHNVAARALDKGFTKQSNEYKMLKGLQDQLSFVNMVPTDDELAMAGRLRGVGRVLENDIPLLRGVPKVFYNMAAKNTQPPDLIRGLTFNHLLGMYNPAQILVQASGAFVSAAIDPIGFPKHVTRMIGWRVADQLSSDPKNQAKVLEWMRTNGMEEFAEDYELWARSGFRETVEQGNADYTSLFTKNMPYDAGIVRKVLANHTLFYKEGELINTRIAFSTAVSRYKKVHQVDRIDPKNEAALDEVATWAEKYRLNMSRANQSDLNKGMTAVPLQFQQIISKYLEKVLPQKWGGTDEFTKWEKFRLFAVPTAITGAAGVPMGSFVTTQVMNMFGIEPGDLSAEETQAVKHGLLGWMTSGDHININFASRMSLSGDIIKNLWQGLSEGKATWQWMGASGSVADRYWRNMQYLSEAVDLTTVRNEDLEFSDLEAMPAIILEAVTDIPTVTRNIKQYWTHLLTDNPQFIKDGKYMWDWETMDKSTAFFGMLGFQPNEMTEIYDLVQELKDSASSFSTWGDTDADVILRIMNTKLLSAKNVQESELHAKIINSMFKKYGPMEQQKLLHTIWDKSMSRRYDQNNLVYKTIIESVERQQGDLNLLNSIVAKKLGERK